MPAGRRAGCMWRHGTGACEGIVDLLVTGSRSYGPVQRALLGSVSEALTEGASHPVLVVPRVGGRAMAAPRLVAP